MSIPEKKIRTGKGKLMKNNFKNPKSNRQKIEHIEYLGKKTASKFKYD
ncbi:hypothetical protein LJC08_01245 [Methanimicrococcus sp. OttesenSCG-928-J09]|nr:hypothetical protein [Methanimicrococcus sp. OttesenSCG-928-J09]